VQTSAGGDTYKQFKAYIESRHEFRYYFNNGLSDAMKTKFQNVFKNKADEWFAPVANGGIDPAKLTKAFGTANKTEFLSKVNNLDNPIYNFIK